MGIKNLTVEILAKALDDICPSYSLLGREALKKKTEKRNAFYQQIENEFDVEWKNLENDFSTKIRELENEKKAVLEHHRERLKREHVNRELDELDKSYEKEVAGKSDSEREEIEKVFLEKTEYINSKNNSRTIEPKLHPVKKNYSKKLESLLSNYKIKEKGYNIRRNQKDRIRMSLQWFVEDFEKVKQFCLSCNIDLKSCYYEVRRRLTMAGRESDELNDLIKKIENHEYQSGT